MNCSMCPKRFDRKDLLTDHVTGKHKKGVAQYHCQDTDTMAQAAQVDYAVAVLLTSLASVTILVDFTYIIVCFKALKKTFYHLTILALFFSDSTLGISSAIFSSGSIMKHEHVGSCLLQIFLIAFGLLSNYCLIFLLCLQRFLVVRSFNFGTSKKFDRNKYTYIGGAICCVFIISLCGTLLTPRVEFMQICRPPLIYGDNFYMFVIVNLLPVIVIIFLLLVMSLTTSFRLLKFHSARRVAPKHVMSGTINNPSNVKPPMFTTGHSPATSSKNISGDIRRKHSMAVVTPIEIEIQLSNLNNEATKDHSEKGGSSEKIRNQDDHCDNSSSKNKESLNKDNYVRKENQNKGMVDTNICTTANNLGHSIDVNIQMKKSWEIRAFFTTVIIAFQTFILTGPFVASFWLEILSNFPLSMQTRLLLFIPFQIYLFSNPFLYAWRIPEIRKEFRRLLRLNN